MTVDEIITNSKKDRFWYAQAESYLQPCLAFSYGFVNCHKVYPIFLKQFIFSLEKNQGYQANGIGDATKPSQYFLELWRKDKPYFKKIENNWRKAEQEQIKITSYLEKIDLKKLPNKELLDLYNDLQDISINTWKYLGLPEIIGVFEEEIFPKEAIKRLKINEKDYIKIASILSTPRQKSFATKFEEELAKIKEASNQGKDIEPLINILIKKYYWIRSGYHGAPILKKKEILQEIKGYKELVKKEFIDRKKIIKDYNIPQDLVDIFNFIALMAHWRDERKRISLPAIYWTFKICDEVARRQKINPKIVYNLTIEEIKNLISGKINVPNHTNPQGNLTFCITKDGIQFFYGRDHQRIFQAYFGKKHSADTLILGMMVSKAGEGKIQGIARVILNPIGANFREGEILVTPMTRPEFVPLMKKAKAVVTDQGGLTCHAAIVSRELGIPCLVGTRFASKILKDGDLVEVNTNHGTVKKL